MLVALDNLMSIEWLYLHSNQLTTISYETFAPILDSVTVLDIHGIRWNDFEMNSDDFPGHLTQKPDK